jgi:tripartite-type tricarboxylate transporter receptor subunit TctC
VLWWGFFAPAGMAPELVTKFNKVLGEIIQEPETRGKLRQLGYETTGSTPEEFKAYVQTEITKWADVIKSEGLDTE